MGYSDLTCDLCSAPLTGIEPCDPPIELAGGRVLWCTFVCEGPQRHRWTVMVDGSEGSAPQDAIVLVPEIRHRRAADELSLRSVLRTVAGVQELVMLVARIELSLVKSVARLERHTGLADASESRRLRELLQTIAPAVEDVERSADALHAAGEEDEDS